MTTTATSRSPKDKRMSSIRRALAAGAALGAATLALAGCGSSSSSSSSTSASSGAASSTSSTAAAANSNVFGTPHKATGTPYVFGLINDETGPVTFPEARQ